MALLLRRSFQSCLRNFPIYTRNQSAFLFTSKKGSSKKVTLVYPDDLFPKKMPPPPKTVEDFAETKNPKSWVSYGYDEENYEEDRHLHRLICFIMLTGVLCGGTFMVSYAPDIGERDWATREAYLELHRREKLGLPLVDKNYIDPSKIELPSDEELGDTEIII